MTGSDLVYFFAGLISGFFFALQLLQRTIERAEQALSDAKQTIEMANREVEKLESLLSERG